MQDKVTQIKQLKYDRDVSYAYAQVVYQSIGRIITWLGLTSCKSLLKLLEQKKT